MKGTAKSRTQRRMEKRQAIILLVVVLIVSLASFTLGVFVGGRGAERELAYKLEQAERVLVAQKPQTTSIQIPENRPLVVEESTGDGKPVGEAEQEQGAKLSFYDDLAKDPAPLGSGINIAPAEEQEVAQEATQPPIDLPDKPIVEKKPEQAPVVAAVEKAETGPASTPQPGNRNGAMPEAVRGGSHAVQIGSFNAAKDAMALKEKMLKQDYPAFVVEADLGDKGLWYRVRIGPYADAEMAKVAQKLIEKNEQIKGFVSRQ